MSQTCGEYNASLTAPAAPPLSPGGDPGEVENDAGWAAVGVVLCELAVFMIALGSDVQRYALTVIEPERRCFGRFSLQNTLWLVGLLTYFGGNGVFVAALGLAPASLCAALMATVVVANALISRVLLKEQLERCDYHGGALIMLGIAVTAAFAPYTSIEYTAGAVGSLIVHPAGLTYLLTLVCFFFCIMFLVLRDEKREREHAHKLECELRVSSAQSRAAAALELSSSAGSAGPGAGGAAGGGAGGGAGGAAGGAAGDASPGRGAGGGAELVAERNSRLHALMPFCYPVLIGTLETLVQMCMKGGSSMLFLTLFPPYESQLCHATFWLVILAWALLSIAVIWWLRKGLERLEASRLLPVEYGTVTATSVVGGLVLYQEARHVDSLNLCFMGVGIMLICLGCGLVGQRQALPRRFMPGAVVAHRMITLRVERQKRHQHLTEVAGPGLALAEPPPPSSSSSSSSFTFKPKPARTRQYSEPCTTATSCVTSPQVRAAATTATARGDLSLSVTVDASVGLSAHPSRV